MDRGRRGDLAVWTLVVRWLQEILDDRGVGCRDFRSAVARFAGSTWTLLAAPPVLRGSKRGTKLKGSTHHRQPWAWPNHPRKRGGRRIGTPKGFPSTLRSSIEDDGNHRARALRKARLIRCTSASVSEWSWHRS